jgi:hypothetical protein
MDTYEIITHRGLTKQSLIDGENTVCSVDNPVTSTESKLVQRLRKQAERKLVLVGYDNTCVFLPGPQDRFPVPSLGHFFLADTLQDQDQVRRAQSFADLGCGAGFLGNYIAKNFEGAREGRIIFGDLFSESINAALNAYMFNNEPWKDDLQISREGHSVSVSGRGSQTIEFRVGDVNQTMHGDSANVAVACPIYIPGVCEVFPQAFALFGAVAKHMGADLYVAHSSLADKVVEAAAEQTGAKITKIRSQEFPLIASTVDTGKNGNPLEDEETLRKLKGLGLIIEEGSNHPHKHMLRVTKFDYNFWRYQ